MNIIYFLLAGLGLTFLVFIHELGHYIVARRNGMKVEVFSIGFGKPIVKWKVGEVEWRFCWILFGGYVKIAGFEKEKGKDPYDVQGGFYHSSPWKRIKVIAMGPIVNIVFAFIAFSAIWMMGGRDQAFSQHTKIIGWVDPGSELYKKGVRPGDEISKIDGHPFRGFKDLLYSSVLSGDRVSVAGRDVNYFEQKEQPFAYQISAYPDPQYGDQGLKTFGIMQPARFLIYSDMLGGEGSGAPMASSGIQPGDRIVWVNGQLVFSLQQLNYLLNQQDALVTVMRGGEQMTVRVPKTRVGDLRIRPDMYGELGDWKHETGLTGSLDSLYTIPYDISSGGRVEGGFHYIDENFKESMPSLAAGELKKGDVIVAIDGKAVHAGYQVLEQLQDKVVRIVVQRGTDGKPLFWKSEDNAFIHSVDYAALEKLTASIGKGNEIDQAGDLHLLAPVVPRRQSELSLPKEYRENYQEYVAKTQEKIDNIKDLTKRKIAQRQFDTMQQQLMLGVALQDRQVIYNPNPLVMMGDVLSDSKRTFTGLLTGSLSPKWLSGPVGFVQALHHGWSLGIKEALYWLGLISLGLGITNLLPIPVLDGGHICFSLFEMTTRRRINMNLMEKITIPFFILLFGMILYITFQDVTRLFTQFFK